MKANSKVSGHGPDPTGSMGASPISRLVTQILWTLVFYSLLRFVFLIWNWSGWFNHLDSFSLAKAFLLGLRFDISSVLTLSSAITIGALLPWPFVLPRVKTATLTVAFLMIHIPFLLMNMGDSEFIQFVGRRFTVESLYLASEVPGKILPLLLSYWHLTAINFFILGLFIYTVLRTPTISCFRLSTKDNSLLKNVTTAALIIIVLVVGIRGGIQGKPIGLAHSAVFSDTKLNHLTLNSSFSFIHSLSQNRLSKKSYLTNEQLNEILPPTPALDASTFSRPQNVILLIMESLSAEYIGAYNNGDGFTPFLDELSKKGAYFPWAFANGRRSIEALPSILAGIPALMDQPFVASPYQTVNIPLIANVVNSRGYDTAFFHGGNNGTMLFDAFSERIGFKKYIGASEYPNKTDHDGVWGIWDEPFFKYMGDQISSMKAPFFVTGFSLSSHHPFKVPAQYEGKFKKGPLPILEVVGYTDMALKKFFQYAETQPWFKDTLFIVTADHTSKNYRESYSSSLGSFRIPMILFHGSADIKRKVNTSRLVQQLDILPTILEATQSQTELPRLGRSLFSQESNAISIYLDNHYFLLKDDLALLQVPSGDLQLYNFKEDPLLKLNLPLQDKKSDLENILKAHIQYFNNALIHNQLM